MKTLNRMIERTCLLAFLILLALPGAGLAQGPASPNLTALSFSPAAIDTSSGSASVTVNFTASDTFSGILYFDTAFVDPSGTFTQRGTKFLSPPRSPATDSVTVTFPRFSRPGTWNLLYVFISDAAGDTLVLDTNGIAAAGFPTALQVTSVLDNTPPSITAFSFSPGAINTAATSANVTVNFTLTDDLSGANSFQAVFTSPSSVQSQTASATFPASTSVTNSATATFPRFSEAGTWTVTSIFVTDAAGNTLSLGPTDVTNMGFPSTLTVTSASDTTPPVLTAFSFTPAAIDVSAAPATVTINVQATDDLSGVTNIQTNFLSPTGATSQTATATFTANTSVTGSATVTFPRTSENGTWTVSSVITSDAVGNTQTLTTAALSGQGFPTQLNVTNTNTNPTPPTIVPTVNPAVGPSGWINTIPVTVSWSVTYPTGMASSTGCGTSTLSAETSGTTFTCTATDKNGASAAASVTVRIDTRPPAIVPVINPAQNTAGWNNTNVSLNWTVTDPVSGVNSDLTSGCDPANLTMETAGTTFTCMAVDGAGLASSMSVTIKIDKTPPTAVAAAAPAPNGAGWNNTNVTVTFTGADALSGIAGCTAPITISTEGTGLSASGVCVDNAGNTSAVATAGGINIDKTPPAISNVTATPNPLVINNATVITATITDSLSGVASAAYNIDGGSFISMSGTFPAASVNVSATTAVFTTTGVHNICVQGTDVAGNTSASQCILFAVYNPDGGFATGGGGTNSPAGSDLNNPSGSGPVTFAFNPKYLPNNQTIPSGDLEFHYDAGSIVFKSTGWDFLVITNGNRAQAQGTGTINGSTTCKFLLDAWAQSFPPGNVDAFGLTIYNCGGGTGNRYNLATTPTTKGSIKIHQ